MKRPRAAIVFVIACSLFGTLWRELGLTRAGPVHAGSVDRLLAATSPAFPVSVKSGDGTVRIPARPERILCPVPQRHTNALRNRGREPGRRASMSTLRGRPTRRGPSSVATKPTRRITFT